jgi:hypothetical protein
MLSDLAIWLNHFEYHAGRRQVPAGLPDELSASERALIAGSIATFQLGEQSDGAALRRTVERFAQAHDLPVLPRITELFVKEEQRHAALLKDFMESHDIPAKARDWTNVVFRSLRRQAGLELHVSVLIAAELIGIVYYRALEAATGCQRLKMLCRTLVADELAHVGFESELLLALRARHGVIGRTLARLAHRALFAAAACVVWATHRHVLTRAGLDLPGFLKACSAQYDFYLEPPAVGSLMDEADTVGLSHGPLK